MIIHHQDTSQLPNASYFPGVLANASLGTLRNATCNPFLPLVPHINPCPCTTPLRKVLSRNEQSAHSGVTTPDRSAGMWLVHAGMPQLQGCPRLDGSERLELGATNSVRQEA